MPTSNGQIGRFDIRREAVRTDHIIDEAITTAKIPDLAVTFPDKIDDPIWSQTFYAPLFHNETVTTTPTSFGVVTVDIPAWVDSASVLAIGNFQLTNTSGGAVDMVCGVEIDGEVLGGNQNQVPNNSTQTMMTARVANLVGLAGSSISVDMEVSVTSGTNSANTARIYGIIVGSR